MVGGITRKSAKRKGAVFQQWVRDLIYDKFPSLEEGDVKSTSMGAGGEDIQLSPAARRKVPYSIECKARKTLPLYAWFMQAKANAPAGAEPMLVVKQDRSRPLVVLDAEYFFTLIGEENGNR